MGRFSDLDIDVHHDLKGLMYEGDCPSFAYVAWAHQPIITRIIA